MHDPLTDEPSPLDLTSLACGSRQHVYLPTGRPEHDWVYKLPSTSGITAQYGFDLREYRPVGLVNSMLYRAFVQYPNERHRSRVAALIRARAPDRFVQRATRRHQALCQARARSLAAAYRWTRRVYFARMVSLAGRLTAEGFADLLLPFRVAPSRRAVLRAADGVTEYCGPIVAQQRADFFDRSGRFDEFDWDDVVTTQHRLWRYGVGLSDANEILGPKNWALASGVLRLADMSSLTRSAARARRLLGDDVLDERQDRVLSRLQREGDKGVLTLARRYFVHVRAEINQSRFDSLWRVAPGPMRGL